MPNTTVFEETDDNNEPVVQKETTVSEEEVEKLKERGLDELAKGKAHADRFIDFLEKQNAELKGELDTRLTAEATLREVKEKRQENIEVSEEPTSPGLEPDDITSLVDKRISEANQNKIIQDNIKEADAKVKAVYGDKAVDFIENKCTELGLTKSDLGGVAAKSPKAFFDLLGITTSDPDTTGVVSTTGTVNLEALTNQSSDGVAKPGTDKWYKELRKKDKKNFYTPAVQQRLFKDRERLGDKFYE